MQSLIHGLELLNKFLAEGATGGLVKTVNGLAVVPRHNRVTFVVNGLLFKLLFGNFLLNRISLLVFYRLGWLLGNFNANNSAQLVSLLAVSCCLVFVFLRLLGGDSRFVDLEQHFWNPV